MGAGEQGGSGQGNSGKSKTAPKRATKTTKASKSVKTGKASKLVKGATVAAEAVVPVPALIPSSPVLDAIILHLRESLLPGDTVGDGNPETTEAWIKDAASCLLAAAGQRFQGTPVIEVVAAQKNQRVLCIAIINDDMPFLVDSVTAAVTAAGLSIDRLLHPVVQVVRDAAGTLQSVLEDAAGATGRESMIYIETTRIDASQRKTLFRVLEQTLADVRAAVTDWPQMVTAMREDAQQVEDAEGADLLNWFTEGNLVQLGHMVRSRSGKPTSRSQRLGICRNSKEDVLSDESYERAFAAFETQVAAGTVAAPIAIKANVIASVHRRVPMDVLLVPYIQKGKVTALSVHVGMWTSAALTAMSSVIPRLRQHFEAILTRNELDRQGHTGKALAFALSSLPHDLLIGFREEDVERLALSMAGLVDRPRSYVQLVRSALQRHVYAFVWVPRDVLNTQIRGRIQAKVEEVTGASTLDWSLQVEAGNLALLRFMVDMRAGPVEPSEAELNHALQGMLRGWEEAVEAALLTSMNAEQAEVEAARYAEAFPLSYRSDYGPLEAAQDISHLHRISSASQSGADVQAEVQHATQRDVRLYAREGDAQNQLRLKIYQSEGGLPLSDAVPGLENFGFRVLAEMPTILRKGALGTIHDFTLELSHGRSAQDVLAVVSKIEDAMRSVLNGAAENDEFNRLVAGLGLSSLEVHWLRAWYRYLRQAGMHLGISTVVDALQGAPIVTRGILDLFRAIHDPSFKGNRTKARQDAEDTIRTALASVTAINDDRLLRAYRDVVLAMLRTNAFAAAGDVALAFKLDSALVPGLPKPLPWREIFVYSERVEGIHLRAGPVARGGLRWSDRRDDYRTEILGLMKAQRVKNAVIVPTGAKGGFYAKQLPDPARDRAAWAAEGQASYEIFIDTLLSITDNIVDGKVVHPEGILVLDGDDPYFVVAADKGTAKFSDVANGIAERRNFWLDDAFASGGSKGYDHKEMGITARGAWLSVQRHFLEMGVDVQNDPVQVVGCGDMSGDVFGNGMLLSKTINLVAAFDHRHIFLDPTPDAAASWEERQRLFNLPVSSWADFEQTLISKGGGVFPRSLKSIPLSPEVQAVLGTTATEMDPETLISTILRAPVDLLWFGGIGTYLKSSAENNVQVGDPSNDALRVSGNEVRAKVIGEGANLGVTQAGRIEFALNGGRINADFIDNSAGVDCSDNEVNIKIAFAAAKRAGKLTEAKRVKLLSAMTDDVAALVLEDNRLQALALSIAQSGGADTMQAQIRLIETLEDGGNLDRRTEGLAENDALLRRAQDGKGLTRPELAVLSASGKLALQAAIENSGLTKEPSVQSLLMEAFPAPMQAKFATFIKGHRLAGEIIATKLANRIINRLGVIIPFELAEEAGAHLAQIAEAFSLADDLFGLSALWAQIEVAPMTESARLTLFQTVANSVRAHMADLLRVGADRMTVEQVASLKKGIVALSNDTDALLSGRTLALSQKRLADLVALGGPAAIVAQVNNLVDLDGAVGAAALSANAGVEPRRLVNAFAHVGAALGLDWAHTSAAQMNPSDPWERLLVSGLARDFQHMRLDFLRGVLRNKEAKRDPLASVQAWVEKHDAAISTLRSIVGRAEKAVLTTPIMLAQIASQARNVLAR